MKKLRVFEEYVTPGFNCKRCKENKDYWLDGNQNKYGLEYKNICIHCITADEKVLIEKQKWDALSTYEKMKKIIFPFSGQGLNLIFLTCVCFSLVFLPNIIFGPDEFDSDDHTMIVFFIVLPFLAYFYCSWEQDQEDEHLL